MRELRELMAECATLLARASIDGVFMGGATIPLHLEPDLAVDFRGTDDVDCVFACDSYIAYHQATQRLLALGFDPDPEGPICRLTRGPLVLDLMPSDPTVLGFANRWYKLAVQSPVETEISGVTIRMFRVEHLLATKVEAFGSRGADDHYASHDMEDIVTLLDGAGTQLELGIERADSELRLFIQAFLRALLDMKYVDDVLEAHLPGERRVHRHAIKERIRAILAI